MVIQEQTYTDDWSTVTYKKFEPDYTLEHESKLRRVMMLQVGRI